jgi:hypothetical protein
MREEGGEGVRLHMREDGGEGVRLYMSGEGVGLHMTEDGREGAALCMEQESRDGMCTGGWCIVSDVDSWVAVDCGWWRVIS